MSDDSIIKYDPKLISYEENSAGFGRMWRLISKEEHDEFNKNNPDPQDKKRQELKEAFDAGFDFGELCGKQGDWEVMDFDEWYKENYE
jgi:hypothetical protein